MRALGKRIVTMRYFHIAAVEHEGKDEDDKKMLSTSIIDEDYRNEANEEWKVDNGRTVSLLTIKHDAEDDLDEDNKE